jgi:hypothetical protein
MKHIKVILKTKNSSDNKGYLRISSRVGNKTILKSLNLPPIEKKYFNPNTQRLRSNFPQCDEYNQYIDNIIEKIKKKGNSNFHINDERKSFIEFIDKVVNETFNYGTKSKYITIKNYLVYFNSEKYGDVDVKFSDINHNFLINLKSWFIQRGIKNNTIVYLFKTLKGLVNKGIKQRCYSYDFDPFGLIQNKLEENSVVYLNIDELHKIISTDVKEVYRGGKNNGEIITNEKVLNDIRYRRGNSLNDIKSYFLFQIHSNGLRCSDIMSLRWNSFYVDNDEIRCQKRMIKTKGKIDFLVNYNCVNILKNYIPISYLDDDISEKINLLNTLKPDNAIEYSDDTKIKLPLNSELLEKIDFDFSDDFFWVSKNDIRRRIEERRNELFKIYNVKNSENILFNIKNTDFEKDIQIKNRNKSSFDLFKINEIITNDDIINYLYKIEDVINKKINLHNISIKNQDDEIELKKYYIFKDIISFLSQNESTKNLFCFNILKNSDFTSIKEDNDFSRITELQYSKFISGRTYYNTLLKYVIKQCGINKKVTTHTSRHSFASLMIQNGDNLNLYDVMTSLGHSSLNTTEKYIQKFKNARVDNLNKKISDLLNQRK